MHWPGSAKTALEDEANATRRHESWRALQELHAAGRCHAIGVSNFECVITTAACRQLGNLRKCQS